MNAEVRKIYEKLVALYVSAGLSPSSAKTFVWLIICEPSEQTAESIRRVTGVSAGGVSEATNYLTKTGLVRRYRKNGDRKNYYEMQKSGFLDSVKQRTVVTAKSRDIANEGLGVLPGNDRLKAMSDIYGFLAERLPRLVDEYEKA